MNLYLHPKLWPQLAGTKTLHVADAQRVRKITVHDGIWDAELPRAKRNHSYHLRYHGSSYSRCFLERYRCKTIGVFRRSNQPDCLETRSEKAKNRDGVVQEKSVRTLFSECVNQCDIRRRPTRFLRMFYHQKHFQLGLKGTETEKNERRL
uniref:Early lymphoid activation gene protein n=1 Tax=Homo sapiens TaxID=9606 RepID=EPAG_HUMAN|nr:RecName: Full=Early lymphoid activation gene protein; AltName: Full=DIAPH2 antisense RNA 1; AltName: Full=DIAPH2 antisense gene protein 1 [Homo sapiens]